MPIYLTFTFFLGLARSIETPLLRARQMQSLQGPPRPPPPAQRRTPQQLPRPRATALRLHLPEKDVPPPGWQHPRPSRCPHLRQRSGPDHRPQAREAHTPGRARCRVPGHRGGPVWRQDRPRRARESVLLIFLCNSSQAREPVRLPILGRNQPLCAQINTTAPGGSQTRRRTNTHHRG